MLSLTRKAGERIIIGDKIWVKVLSVAGGVVRLGIEAPEEIKIDRLEAHNAGREKEPRSNPEDATTLPGL